MGYLFENMEKMDIQAERRNTALARAEAEAAKQKAEAAEQKAEAAAHKAEQKLISLIKHRLAKNLTVEQIADDLLEPTDYIRELMSRIPQTDD